MIILRRLRTIVLLNPRTGSTSLLRALQEFHKDSMFLYRHMEADGVPYGYESYRKVGVVRHPVDRLWSYYKLLKSYETNPMTKDTFKPVEEDFSQWILKNELLVPNGTEGRASRLHLIPENKKSQETFLRPDLGTEIFRFETELSKLEKELAIKMRKLNTSDKTPIPELSFEAKEHIRTYFKWDLDFYNDSI